MKYDIVNFKQAKKLEPIFRYEETKHCYDKDGKLWYDVVYDYPAPSIFELIKWIDEHSETVNIYISKQGDEWSVEADYSMDISTELVDALVDRVLYIAEGLPCKS